MNKVLVSATLALALIAGGNAFAGSDIDETLYAEANSVVNGAMDFVPAAGPMSPQNAALYEEVSSGAIAYQPTVDLSEQFADRRNAATNRDRFVAE